MNEQKIKTDKNEELLRLRKRVRELEKLETHHRDTEHKLQESLVSLQKRTAEINALLDASRAVLKNKVFQDAAQSIFNTCKQLIGATAGYVALLTSDGSENEVLFLDSGGRPCTVDEELPMPIRGLREHAYKDKTAVYENNFWESKWTEFLPEGHVRMDNVMFSPLVIDDKAVGLIGLANKDGDFTDEDANMAQAFGELAAIALMNSRALESLEKSEKNLQELNISKDKFFSIIAHDLKGALTGFLGLSGTLSSEFSDLMINEIKELAYHLNKSANNLNRLLDNLLQWSRAQTGRIEVHPELIDIGNLIEKNIRLFHASAEAKNIGIRHSIDGDLIAHADMQMIDTVLRNLISNAIKFTGKNGEILISAYEDIGSVRISIKDNGVGINPKIMKNMFRIDNVTSTKGTDKEPGSGLGLIVCKEFLQMNHGDICVESRPGDGSEFTIKIPKAEL